MILLLLQAAIVQPAPPPQDKRDIVVTATRLEDSERNWKSCRNRHCPPDEEIAAALAHGENLFVAGDYRESRGVLAATIDNTRGAEKRYPVAVGDLRRAEARVASHMGETDDVRRGMLASSDALKTGLGAADPRALVQRLQIGDAMMLGGPQPMSSGYNLFYNDSRRGALKVYDGVARDARRLGQPEIEARALIRTASLLITLAASARSTYEPRARAVIRQITETTDPRFAPFRDAATMLEANLDIALGDTGAVDRLVANYRGAPSDRPVLLYSPPIDWRASRDRTISAARRAIVQNAAQQIDAGRTDEWIDIGFRIRPDGRVEDVDTLRESTNRTSDWIDPVLTQVRGRRYAPLAIAGSAGQLRVERHTYTASFANVTDTRIRQKTGIPRVVVTDLTNDAPATARATGGTAPGGATPTGPLPLAPSNPLG